MTVACSAPSERSRVKLHEEISGLQKDCSALFEAAPTGWGRLLDARRIETLSTQPPRRLFGDGFSRTNPPVIRKQNAASRQSRAPEAVAFPERMEQSAAIVVAAECHAPRRTE